MQAQEPAVGILKRNDWGDTKMYHIPCSCCGADCAHDVWVEADNHAVTVTTHTRQKVQVLEPESFSDHVVFADSWLC